MLRYSTGRVTKCGVHCLCAVVAVHVISVFVEVLVDHGRMSGFSWVLGKRIIEITRRYLLLVVCEEFCVPTLGKCVCMCANFV